MPTERLLLDCIVAGTEARGVSGFLFVRVECNERQRKMGDHADAAREYAFDNGLSEPLVVFQRTDGPSWLFENFPRRANRVSILDQDHIPAAPS